MWLTLGLNECTVRYMKIYHVKVTQTDEGADSEEATYGVWTFNRTQALRLCAERLKKDGFTAWTFNGCVELGCTANDRTEGTVLRYA